MQRFILFYEKVNLWGKAVYFPEYRSEIVTSIPAISQAEVLKLFVEPLLFLRERLPGEINGQSVMNDFFFPSRDFPSLLLARIYMEQGKIAESGTHEQLMAQNKAYAALFNKQQELEHFREEAV